MYCIIDFVNFIISRSVKKLPNAKILSRFSINFFFKVLIKCVNLYGDFMNCWFT